ncbi:hypothetical protein DL766_010556 [Monosporascus sp. MC13-8B]|uniref:Glycogenin n=1 Tax=Monosporascus cannonballus TaxID=155416 RepID=A0ABY0H4H5_9PEZI|nr:hypothetical protein DL762_005580 [Monosporascus cannonballus]RYP02063.1 hypothetical protein DL766_010556 [Monosporascus sp. MC13-8B]
MAAQGEAGDVYATLLLSDTYLSGALVLAHSLRDNGTTKKLAVLVTPDTVSVEVIDVLKGVYDHVIPVDTIRNSEPANLRLMNRTDLHSVFTKIHLWKQTQFRKIVYVDADVVAYRAPDELFDITEPFSAAPDIGWPDLFNTGVMVLTPNMDDFDTMSSMAQRNMSFDGADQGLINMHFKDKYNRLSFTYNVTPSAHYQYIPAYRHFQSSINMVHFIGPEKPWLQGRQANTGSTPFNEMYGRWWAVYDRHYQTSSQTTTPSGVSLKTLALVQYFTRGEYQPKDGSSTPQFTYSSWDARKHAPPTGSRGEAENFHTSVYEMSRDTALFASSQGYGRKIERPPPIFPWEPHQPQPSRVFPDDLPQIQTAEIGRLSVSATNETSVPPSPTASTRSEYTEMTSDANQSEPTTPTTPTMRATSSDPWTTFTRTNAWDAIPEIERYVDSLQKRRRKQSLKSQGASEITSPGQGVDEAAGRRRGSKVTDFPTEEERPSLPVTPAPIRRPKFWSSGGPEKGYDGGEPMIPAAEGVPEQTEWDPVAQLQKLAKQQSEALLRKLGGSSRDSSDLPPRPLPFGSEKHASPAHHTQDANIVSPQPIKGDASSSAVRGILSDDPDATPVAAPRRS